ncbi:MAG TPA: secretin N-terminal domain-containing protein [Phycisphaerales bacterium]
MNRLLEQSARRSLPLALLLVCGTSVAQTPTQDQPARPAQPAPGTPDRPEQADTPTHSDVPPSAQPVPKWKVQPAPGQPGGEGTKMPPRTPPTKVTPANGAAQPAAPNPGVPVPGAHLGAQPGANPDPANLTSTDPNMIELAAFTAPVELTTLVDMLVKQLGINVAIKGNLSGSVSFNAPVSVPKDRFLRLITALLEQQNFTITKDEDTGFYLVHPLNEVGVGIGGDHATTRVIPTPNVRPSALKSAIEAQFGGGGGGGGGPIMNPGNPGGGGVTTGSGALGQAAYIDELGVIVMTGSSRKLDAVESMVKLLLDEFNKAKFHRFDLKFVAASVARERALQLIGQVGQSRGAANPGFPGGGDPAAAVPSMSPTGRPATLDNLSDRLTIDPQGNALVFRGVPEEITKVREVLEAIDVASTLTSTKYEVGLAAKQIADLARQRGLGEVTTIASTSNRNNRFQQGFFGGEFNDGSQRLNQRTTAAAGGPVMVVDEDRGLIIYYATPEQQELLADLIRGINLDDDIVVVKEYKLKYASAEKVAEIINGLLTNRTPAAESSLLPGSGSNSTNANNRFNRNNTQPTQPQQPVNVNLGPDFGGGSAAAGTNEGGIGFSGGPNVFVLADKPNNQVLVKAPARQQREFAQLIERIDLRRPQVHIEAQLVAVTAGDDYRLAFETQLVNANGSGGVLNTSFGLSSFGTGAGINQAKTVATGLSGLTSAVIKSQYVPIVLNALASTTDTKILSKPSIMVNDNEKAKIERVDQQPTTQANQGTSTTTTSFAGYEDAGTDLEITPRISGNLVTLEIAANLSAFEGSGSGGIPPPRNKAGISNKAVTVPSDMTVVIGGITLNTRTDTVRKVPLLGDIPLVGYLFRDTNKTERKTVLYIFITPRIINDPGFEDMRLLTSGPQQQVELDRDLPPIKPVLVDFFVPLGKGDADRPTLHAPAQEKKAPGHEPIHSDDPLPPPLPIKLPGTTPKKE